MLQSNTNANASGSIIKVFFILGVAVSLSFASYASAQITEPGFASEVVAENLSLATGLAFTPDGRIFIAEKGGTIKVVKDGVLLSDPLVTLTDVNTFGDRGLIGLAVDPNFATNGYIYVSYTFENSPGFNIAGPKTGRIVRLTVVGDTASESSKLVLVGSVGGSATSPSCENFAVTDDCIASDSNSHSVGGLRFGTDGKLYASLGDGADFSTVDPRALRAQNVNALAGKMLRINTDGTAPADNPFYDGNPNSNKSKVYALGLRNSFRLGFHPTTNLLYSGDVGWGSWEEVNLIEAGKNYGWPCREGNVATSYGCTPSSAYTNPLYTYAHNSAGAGSIIAGAFPANSAYPAQYGNSLFIGDYAQMWVKRLVLNASGTAMVSVEDFVPDTVWPVEIITGPDGNIYYLDIVFGSLNRITHTSGNRKPAVNISANKNSGATPLNVNFSSAGTADPDGDLISYDWQFGDGASSTLANPTHTFVTSGVFNTALTVTDVHGAKTAKSIKIFAGNQAPVANITNPASGSLYKALESITVTGQGTDTEDGVLAPSATSWTVLLHHNTHVHTITQATGVNSITFTADDHNDSDVYMEIVMKVTDSLGLSSTKSINMYLNNGAGAGNLVPNPSVETEGLVAGSPLDWYQGWYGVMNPVFTYPVTGLVGDKAIQLDVLSYESGGAKWFFSPTFVTSGSEYVFSNIYTATVGSDITAQYGRADGSYFYEYLGFAPATASPVRNNLHFTVPVGAQNVTIYQEVNNVGQIILDDFALTLASNGDTVAPTGNISNINNGETVSGIKTVEINAADNIGVASVHLVVNGAEVGVGDSEPPYSSVWDTTTVPDGNYTLSAHIHDTSGNEGTAPVINVTVLNNATNTAVNLINNGDFEQMDSNGKPVNWTANTWGDHVATFQYPVVGRTGGNAIQTTISNYLFSGSGDSKWVFSKVNVTPGKTYNYSDYYKSNIISDIIGQYQMADGSYHYFGLIKEIQPNPEWTKVSSSFTPPVGATHVTLFHLISSVGYVAIDDAVLTEIGTGTPAEIIPPVVEFTNPLNGQTVSGNVTLTASSSDNVAVTYIFYAVNGTPITGQLTTAPYSFVWDTTKLVNGNYTLKATTHDPSGNNSTAVIDVTVNNTATTTPPSTTNLVPNGDFETAGTAGNPANWSRGGWGTNTRTFNYPVAGDTGNGAEVVISGYTNGDAKWYFNPIAIVGGTEYTISDKYKSTVESEILVQYTLANSAFQYQFLTNLPNSNNTWQTFTQNVTAPADATHVTLFHLIAGNGSLVIDDVNVGGSAAVPPVLDTTKPVANVTSPTDLTNVSGTVNISANATDNVGVAGVRLLVNGVLTGTEDVTNPYQFSWDSNTVSNGTNTIAVQARDAANNLATSTAVVVFVNNTATTTPPSTTNLVPNGDFETAGTAGNPANWSRGGWGTNTRTFNYPVAGDTGNGAEVVISGYTNGDAKWYFNPIAIVGGTEYTISDKYKSTVESEILVQYTLANSAFQYQFLTNLPNSNNTWQTFTQNVTAPADATHVTLFHLIAGNGSLVIDDVNVGGSAAVPPVVDTTAPSVMINNPVNNSEVSDTVVVTVDATDNVGVSEVEILINGVPHGSVDTTSPYSFVWDTKSVTSGAYTITAIARDVVGNERESSVVNVTVNNVVVPPNTDNLLDNGDLESGSGDTPTGWNRGGWGTNTRVLNYPVAGKAGNGIEVVVSDYVDGDAKWYFDPVAVIGGAQYTVSDEYKSTLGSEVLARYTLANGTFQYQFIANLPATDTWQNFSQTITTPADATHVTLFHIIAGNGSLVIDDVSVR